MIRITNNLFESIQKVMQGEQPAAKVETKEVAEGQVDKAHYCATHVEHSIFGEGECIAEAHADPDADGNVEWYTVQFKDGIRKVYTEAMKVKKAKMHEHADVSDEVIAEMVDELSDDELVETLEEASYSAKAARAGKDIGKPGKMFGKIAASAAKRYGSAERGRKVAGAVLAKLRKMDEAEDLDELDKSTLGSYVKKASRDVQQNTYRSGLSAARGVVNNPSINKTQKRQTGIAKAVDRLTSEEFEDLDELDKSTLGSYVKKAARDVQQNTYRSGLSAARGVTNEPSISKTQKRQQGIAKAVNKLTSEDIEQTNEAQTSAAARYVKAKMSSQAKTTMKGMDPVGKEDKDINNDGKTYKSDSYLHNRRKAIKAAMKEEITVVLENILTVEVPSSATYADYLDAVKTIIGNDDPEFQQDIVKIAAEAFDTGEIEIIAEAELIKNGVLEAYKSTADYGSQKLYSKELSGTVDRTKPGVVRFSRDTQQTIGMDQKTRKAKKEREAKVFGSK